MNQFIRIALLSYIALATSGCASYVNIPADYQKDPAINTIDVPPTPKVIATALEYALHDFPPAQRPFAVALPTPASSATWSTVLGGRPNASSFDPDAPDIPLYDVRSIRIRGHDAQVDILLPESSDDRPVLEVHLEGSLAGWKIKSVRRWSRAVLDQPEESSGREPRPDNLNPVRSASQAAESQATPADQSASGRLVPIRVASQRANDGQPRDASKQLEPVRFSTGQVQEDRDPAEASALHPVRTTTRKSRDR